jgi:hypothetical protein
MLSHSRVEKGGRLVNDPVSRFSLRAKVSDVLRDAVIADGFDIPAASIFIGGASFGAIDYV